MTGFTKRTKSNVVAFALFSGFFCTLFIQYPLTGSLTGNSDTIACLAIFRHYSNVIEHLVQGTFLGTSFYPNGGIHLFAEPYYGQYLIFAFFKLITRSDLWSQYFLISMTYALNAWGVYLIAILFSNCVRSAFFSGLLFSGSSYMLSNVELYNGTGYFFALLSIWYLLRYVRNSDDSNMYLCFLFGGAQVYWSGYIFVFLNIAFVVIMMFNWRVLTSRFKAVKVLSGCTMYVLLILPYIFMFVGNPRILDAFNPIDSDHRYLAYFSMGIFDLLRPFDSNLFYSELNTLSPEPQRHEVIRNMYVGNLGIIIYLLALYGFVSNLIRSLPFVIIALIGLLISFGPSLHVGDRVLTMPMDFIYENTPLAGLFRIPGRAFSLWVLSMSIIAGVGLSQLLSKVRYSWAVFSAILVTSVLENIPMKHHHSAHHHAILNPDPGYVRFLREVRNENTVVLELPSSLFSDDSRYRNGISEFTREYTYALWQTFTGVNVVNGSSAFWPQPRMEINRLIQDIPERNGLQELVAIYGVTHVVYHPELVIHDRDRDLLSDLCQMDILDSVLTSDRVRIFEVNGKALTYPY